MSVALLTTIRSMISPGTLLESKTWVLPGVAAMADSCGFQVTTACTLGAAKAPTMSASEVLTTLMSRSRRPAASRPRASR